MVYQAIRDYIPRADGTAVALGYFDGVHRGHRAVLKKCAENRGGLRSVALTFAENPAAALGKDCPPTLTDNVRKAALMKEVGIGDVIFADFSALRALSPEEFVRDILRDRLNAKSIFCGFNYRFGKNGAGDTEKLRELCARYGMETEIVTPVYVDGEAASSTRIRELIAAGEIERANALLGYRFGIEGDIGHGNHLGTAMGFPTVNLPIGEGMATPRYGVYASRMAIGGRVYRGATNIGVHPTVGENVQPLCETFLLDYRGEELYGKHAVCELVQFVRGERKFGSMDELVAQVERDCERIAAIEIDADIC